MKVTAFAAALLFVTTGAFAQINGNELLRQCTPAEKISSGDTSLLTKDDFALADKCLARVDGFIWGVMLEQMAYDRAGVTQQSGICIPNKTNALQMASVIVKHLRANPAERHNSANLEMFFALYAAFACK
jgi:hypothetical protein